MEGKAKLLKLNLPVVASLSSIMLSETINSEKITNCTEDTKKDLILHFSENCYSTPVALDQCWHKFETKYAAKCHFITTFYWNSNMLTILLNYNPKTLSHIT